MTKLNAPRHQKLGPQSWKPQQLRTAKLGRGGAAGSF